MTDNDHMDDLDNKRISEIITLCAHIMVKGDFAEVRCPIQEVKKR